MWLEANFHLSGFTSAAHPLISILYLSEFSLRFVPLIASNVIWMKRDLKSFKVYSLFWNRWPPAGNGCISLNLIEIKKDMRRGKVSK